MCLKIKEGEKIKFDFFQFDFLKHFYSWLERIISSWYQEHVEAFLVLFCKAYYM